MRYLKWAAFGLAGLIVLGLLGLAVVVWVVDPNTFKPRIEAAVKQATGRDFALVGDIDLKFFPWLALSTGEGHFGNAPGFPAEPMATWHRAQLGVKLLPLLAGDLAVDRIKLIGADLRLTRRADGTANWEGIGDDAPADPNAPERHVTIDGLEIDKGRLLFVDEAAPLRVEITDLRLVTDAIEPDQPFTDTEMAGVLRMEGFASEGVPFKFESPQIALTKDYSSLEVEQFEAQFGVMEIEGAVGGELGEPMKLSGKLTTNTFDLRALLGSIGIEAPKTTDPKALGLAQLAANWRFDAGAIDVELLTLTLDQTGFTGKFQRDAGDEPVGEFELRGSQMDIARYIPPTDPESEPFVLPTADLRALKFRGVVQLEQATLDDIVMKGVTLRLLLDEQGLRSQPEAAAK